MFAITLRQAWILAAVLLFLDILVLMLIVNRPVDPADIEPTKWDFRILEVREIEIKTAAVQLDLPVVLSDVASQPTWLQPYFPQAGQVVAPTTQWQLGFAETLGDRRP